MFAAQSLKHVQVKPNFQLLFINILQNITNVLHADILSGYCTSGADSP